MAKFTASYTSATGQSRSVIIQAKDVQTARKQLRRRGIKATELKATETSTGKSSKETSSSGGILSVDLGKLLQKPPGVKDKAVWASKLAALV
ncbi:MAG: type II secretion system F family protein, partial [Synechococcus sp. BS307-5m-G39]|nr:type II secretion system F family protein [Synechococcus sp. BS307-5m-G39]